MAGVKSQLSFCCKASGLDSTALLKRAFPAKLQKPVPPVIQPHAGPAGKGQLLRVRVDLPEVGGEPLPGEPGKREKINLVQNNKVNPGIGPGKFCRCIITLGDTMYQYPAMLAQVKIDRREQFPRIFDKNQAARGKRQPPQGGADLSGL